MIKRVILSMFFVGNILLSVADDFRFNHGPYLQNLSSNEVTLFFSTSARAFSRVEVKGDGWEEPKCFYTLSDGLVQAYNTQNAIRVTGLEPGREYSYRLVAKEMKQFHPYKIVYGDSIATRWESFTTVPEEKDSCSFVIINDGHDDAQKVARLLGLSQLDKADAVIYLGDMTSYIDMGMPLASASISVNTESLTQTEMILFTACIFRLFHSCSCTFPPWMNLSFLYTL